MNFIEAHNICSNYVDIFSNNKSFYLRMSSLRACGASSKADIEDAMILLFAHAILWNELSSEDFERFLVLLMQLDNFIDDDAFISKYEENQAIVTQSNSSMLYKMTHRKRVEEAINFIANNTKPHLHDTSRISNILTHIAEYKKSIITPKLNTLIQDSNSDNPISHEEYWSRFLNLVGDFSDEVYRLSNISTTPTDFYLFVSFELMRDWIDDPVMKKHYGKYKDYILSYFDPNNKKLLFLGQGLR